jgi:hypothetical protein
VYDVLFIHISLPLSLSLFSIKSLFSLHWPQNMTFFLNWNTWNTWCLAMGVNIFYSLIQYDTLHSKRCVTVTTFDVHTQCLFWNVCAGVEGGWRNRRKARAKYSLWIRNEIHWTDWFIMQCVLMTKYNSLCLNNTIATHTYTHTSIHTHTHILTFTSFFFGSNSGSVPRNSSLNLTFLFGEKAAFIRLLCITSANF